MHRGSIPPADASRPSPWRIGISTTVPAVRPLPWGPLLRWAVIGTLAVVCIALWDLSEHGGRNPVSLIQAGSEGPARDVVLRDFPQVRLPGGLGHDGQQFYAIARAPMHLDDVAESLDRPRYRLQRPLYPWLAWLIHPFGGGSGLVWAMFAVNAAALLGLGLAAGALASSLRGPPWIAAVAPLLPVGYVSLRISTADALALALTLAALALDLRGRTGTGVGTAALGVLAKESSLVVLFAWALTRRSRPSWTIALSGAAVAGGWWLWLRRSIGVSAASVTEFGAPFRGLAEGVSRWVHGEDAWAAAAVISAVVLTTWVAARRRGHPLLPAVVASAMFLIPLNGNVVGLNLNATRTLGPLMALGLIAIVTPRAALAREG